MNLLLFSTFLIICAAAVDSRYPYDDGYTTGDIVPHGYNTRYPYGRDGGYVRKQRGGVGGYAGILQRKKNQNGRYRDSPILGRDYRRRHRDYDSYLPPRGIGGYKKPHYDRPYDYEGGRYRRPQISRPPKYYDEDEINYGGYSTNIGRGIRYS